MDGYERAQTPPVGSIRPIPTPAVTPGCDPLVVTPWYLPLSASLPLWLLSLLKLVCGRINFGLDVLSHCAFSFFLFFCRSHAAVTHTLVTNYRGRAGRDKQIRAFLSLSGTSVSLGRSELKSEESKTNSPPERGDVVKGEKP